MSIKTTMKAMSLLATSLLFFGCASNPVNSTNGVYRVALDADLNGSAYDVNSRVGTYLNKKQSASQNFISEISKNDFIKKWLSHNNSKSKAIFAIDPKSCDDSYYYGSWNYKDNFSAIKRAYDGCIKGAEKRNKALGKDCNCRLTAINNTFFYEPKTYERHMSSFPWIMEVEENGVVTTVNGMAKLTLNSGNKAKFTLKNDKGREVCNGDADFSAKGSTGKINIDCFNGKISGSGEIIRKSFDSDLRVYSGTAKLKTNNGEMRVIYGKLD